MSARQVFSAAAALLALLQLAGAQDCSVRMRRTTNSSTQLFINIAGLHLLDGAGSPVATTSAAISSSWAGNTARWGLANALDESNATTTLTAIGDRFPSLHVAWPCSAGVRTLRIVGCLSCCSGFDPLTPFSVDFAGPTSSTTFTLQLRDLAAPLGVYNVPAVQGCMTAADCPAVGDCGAPRTCNLGACSAPVNKTDGSTCNSGSGTCLAGACAPCVVYGLPGTFQSGVCRYSGPGVAWYWSFNGGTETGRFLTNGVTANLSGAFNFVIDPATFRVLTSSVAPGLVGTTGWTGWSFPGQEGIGFLWSGTAPTEFYSLGGSYTIGALLNYGEDWFVFFSALSGMVGNLHNWNWGIAAIVDYPFALTCLN